MSEPLTEAKFMMVLHSVNSHYDAAYKALVNHNAQGQHAVKNVHSQRVKLIQKVNQSYVPYCAYKCSAIRVILNICIYSN